MESVPYFRILSVYSMFVALNAINNNVLKAVGKSNVYFCAYVQFEYKNLIIENYKKGEHRNLSKFLSTLEHKKNVVYTFSTDLDIIRNINGIENKKFNLKIRDENIKKIKIRGIKSESQFDNELNYFLENDNYKICLQKRL